MLTKEQGLINLGPEEVARRTEAERLYLASRDAPDHPDEIIRQMDDLDEELNEKIEALEKEYGAKKQQLIKEPSEREKAEAAWQEYDGFLDVAVDDYDDPRRCSLTGLLIEEEEETIEIHGREYIIAALGLPVETREPFVLPDEIT